MCGWISFESFEMKLGGENIFHPKDGSFADCEGFSYEGDCSNIFSPPFRDSWLAMVEPDFETRFSALLKRILKTI